MKLISDEKLLFGLPIKIKGLGTVYQPTLHDFINNNIDIQKFMGIFNLKIDVLEDTENLKDFDLFLFQIGKVSEENLWITELIKYLQLLYRTEEVKLVALEPNDINAIGISIEVNKDEKYFINRENYNELVNVVLIMLGSGKNIADEKVKEELNSIELEMAKRRRKFEKEKAKKNKEVKKDDNETTIYDLINFIIHTDNSQFDYENILNLTIYQINNTFNLYMQKENYKYYMDYKTSGQFKIEDKLDHWYFKK